MEMNGGGKYGLQAGQGTDDSELATHLLIALSSFSEDKPLAKQEIKLVCQVGKQYVRWLNTNPFDLGSTSHRSIRIAEDSLHLL
jgi:hypothetical protein